jgi:hypothetical protein
LINSAVPHPRQRGATVPKAVWERRSCGAGTKGARYYDWAAVAVTVKDSDAPTGALADAPTRALAGR